MSLEIILPPGVEPGFLCLVCGEPHYTSESLARHVVRCARENEGVIEEYRQQKRPEWLYGEADPEYRRWQKRTGKLI